MFVPNFKILDGAVPGKSLTQISLCITLEWEMEKRRNGKSKTKENFLLSSIFHFSFSFTQYTSTLCKCIQYLKTLALLAVQKSVTKNILDEKKNGQIKGMISLRMLILSYTIQQVIPNVYAKFQYPRWSSSWEIFDKIFFGVKEKWTNKGNDKYEDADSFLYDTSGRTQCLYQISKS